MAKKPKKTQPKSEALPETNPTPTTPQQAQPAPEITVSLFDYKKPVSGTLFGVFGDRTENTEIAGTRFDQIIDSSGRYITASDHVTMWGNPIRGITLGCGSEQPPVNLFLEHSEKGISGYGRSALPGDNDERASIAPELFKAIVDAEFLKTTGKTLQQISSQSGDVVNLTAESSPIEAVCHTLPVQQAIQRSKPLTR